MSLHDFRRIALAHDLLVRDWRKSSAAQRTGLDRKGAEPAQERIPAETAAQEGNG